MVILARQPTLEAIRIEARVLGINAHTELNPLQHTRVSTEALQVNFVHKKMAVKLKELWGTTSTFIGKLFTNTPQMISPSLDLSKVVRTANSRLYLTDSELKITVPQDFNGTYVEYLDVLQAMVDASIAFCDDTLVPFKTWVGECLNDPAKIQSVRGHHGIETFDPTTLIKRREALFKGKSNQAKYGKVFRRNADWKTLEDSLNSLLTKMAGMHSPAAVNDLVKQTDTMIGLLIDNMLDPQQTYVASPQNIQALSMLCYNLAKMIEFYGLTCYSIQQLITAVNTNAEEYLKVK